jgi:hypothetical protein
MKRQQGLENKDEHCPGPEVVDSGERGLCTDATIGIFRK